MGPESPRIALYSGYHGLDTHTVSMLVWVPNAFSSSPGVHSLMQVVIFQVSQTIHHGFLCFSLLENAYFGNRTVVSKELGLLGFSASKFSDTATATCHFEPFSDCSSDLNCSFRPSLSHGASCLALCSYRTACEFLHEVSFESKYRNERPHYCACTVV